MRLDVEMKNTHNRIGLLVTKLTVNFGDWPQISFLVMKSCIHRSWPIYERMADTDQKIILKEQFEQKTWPEGIK
jgi:hypothetical protein